MGVCASEYLRFYWSNILRFSANRFYPYVGISIVSILIANKNFEEFSYFSYISSAFIFPATIATFTFYAIGNLPTFRGIVEPEEVFSSTFLLALVSASLVAAACSVILLFSSDEMSAYPSDYKTKELAIGYLVYIFLYTLTCFFNCYFEAWVQDRSSNIGRMINFVPLSILALFNYVAFDSLNFSYVMVVLMVVCVFLELIYYVYISCTRRMFCSRVNFDCIGALVKIGAPQGFGLALQRLAFFMVNKRLLLVDKDFVSVFSVAISLVSLLAIPVSAFTQIHSIHVTRNKAGSLSLYPILILIISAFPSGVVVICLDEFVLPFYGLRLDVYEQDPLISVGILAMLISTALLMLVTAHLRAYGQTVKPQVIINLAVYGIYVSTVYSGFLDHRPLSYLLFTYAFTFFICFLLLVFRERLDLLNFTAPKKIL